MRYKNASVSLSKLIIGNSGTIKPLCNDCKTRDCTHSIERKKVSVFGMTKEYRVMMKGPQPFCVVQCEGFSV